MPVIVNLFDPDRLQEFCRELVNGCWQCLQEAEYRRSVGHQCGEDGERFVSVCTVFGEARRASEEFHRATHEPTTCEKCGARLRDNLGYDAIVVKPCRSGRCERWCCPACGGAWATIGPVDCPSCGSDRDPRLTRCRVQYRRRRRYW